MDDLISRQDAIDDLHSKSQLQIWDTEDVEVWINDLPSASTDLSTFSDKLWKIAYERGKEEARKKGKWIKIPEFCGDDVSGFIDNHFSCSECKKEAEINSWGFYILSNFCPNCGADMREGEEE